MFKQFINFQTRVFSGEDRGQVRNQGGRSGAKFFPWEFSRPPWKNVLDIVYNYAM